MKRVVVLAGFLGGLVSGAEGAGAYVLFGGSAPAGLPLEPIVRGVPEVAVLHELSSSAAEPDHERSTERPSAPKEVSYPPFDMVAADEAVTAVRATFGFCRSTTGPSGPGEARVSFENTGEPAAVELGKPYAHTEVGACILRRLSHLRIPRYRGRKMWVAVMIDL